MKDSNIYKEFVTISSNDPKLDELLSESGLNYVKIADGYTFAADKTYKSGIKFLTPIGVMVKVTMQTANGNLSVIPVWLRPFATIDPKEYPMHASQSQTPTQAICNIQRFLIRDFTKDEIREISHFINDHIFSNPIDNDMLELMLVSDVLDGKEEEKPKPRLYNALDYDGMSPANRKLSMTEDFLTYGHVKLINERVHILSELKPHTYTAAELEIRQRLHEWNKAVTTDEAKTIVWKAGGLLTATEEPPYNLVMCQNGIYDYATDSLLDFNDELAFTNPPINAEYDESAYSGIVDKTLDKISCNDESVRMLLEEIIGACLCRDNRLIQTLFILYGDGSNGKSVYINMVQKLLGFDNYSTIKMQEFETDKFVKIDLYGKLANFGDDIPAEFMKETSTWKNVATGDAPIRGERKGEQSFMFRPYATPIFSCNEIPKVGDLTNGWFRRVVYVPFNAVFSPNDKDFDPLINEKLATQEALNYLFKLGIAGLKRILTNRTTTTGTEVSSLKSAIRIESDSLLGFVNEYGKERILDNATQDIYNEYLLFCANNGHKYPITKTKMSRRLNKEYGIGVKICSGNRQIYKLN